MAFPIREIILFAVYVGFVSMTFYLLGFLERKKVEKAIKTYFCTIIIPAYNEEKTLEKTVKSVRQLNYPQEKLEIMIVDDGSKDKTDIIGKNLARKYKNVKYFRKQSGGKGSALNYGIKRAKGELIISLDADSMVTPDALKYMIPHFNDPKVMSVTPAMKIYKPKGILQRVQAIEYDLGIFLRKVFADLDSIHVTPGPFSIYRKIFFEKHGGYDETTITEDLEIAMRIQSLHYKIKNSPKALVYTIGPRKLKSLTMQRRRWYFGMITNLRKYRHLFSKEYGTLGMIILPLSIISILTVIIIAAYTIIKGISQWLNQAQLYSSIGFDFINNLNFQWYLFSLNFHKVLSESIVIFSVIFIVFAVGMLIFINKRVKSIDRPITVFINYIFFMLFYSILFSIWWIIAGVYSQTKKQVKW